MGRSGGAVAAIDVLALDRGGAHLPARLTAATATRSGHLITDRPHQEGSGRPGRLGTDTDQLARTPDR